MTQPDIFNDPIKANELAEQKLSTERQLENVMAEWEELQEKNLIYLRKTSKSIKFLLVFYLFHSQIYKQLKY